jgi:hypothetical protein
VSSGQGIQGSPQGEARPRLSGQIGDIVKEKGKGLSSDCAKLVQKQSHSVGAGSTRSWLQELGLIEERCAMSCRCTEQMLAAGPVSEHLLWK